MGTPAAEIAIDEALVRRLLTSQHPDLAAMALTEVGAGWDNGMWRLGEGLCVRLPRRAVAAPLIENEAWLNTLAPWLPLPTPVTIRRGLASDVFPWPWRIAAWIEGTPAHTAPPKPGEAAALAKFLKALHRTAPLDAPANSVRGVPLADRAASVEERFVRIADAITPPVRAAWDAALATPPATMRVWLHGDLHPRNVLTRDGALAAIIDWGDICAGDPATDLAAFWMLFEDARIRDAALKEYGADAALIARARGWAILFGAVLLDTGRVDTPAHAEIGSLTLKRAG
jgi:aminoglycoside phosphotransferase (APT) family kinase protein